MAFSSACASCASFDAAERAAIDGGELPAHALDVCTCESDEFDVLYLSVEQFARAPQNGTPCRMPWSSLAAYLSRPTVGDTVRFPDPDEAKRQSGAWSPCLYRGNHRCKSAVIHAGAITFDIDGGGEVARAAEAFRAFRKIVHSTYKSKPEAPRCRVVLQLARLCTDARAYDTAHAAVRRSLAARGFACDDGAKDISRLNFAPMVYPGREFSFLSTDGLPFDVERFAATVQPPLPTKPPPKPEHRDRYVRGALQRSAEAVFAASVGDRHHLLGREAYTLSRAALGLSLDQVRAALLEPFVVRAGEPRRREGERTIADAFRASRGELS